MVEICRSNEKNIEFPTVGAIKMGFPKMSCLGNLTRMRKLNTEENVWNLLRSCDING